WGIVSGYNLQGKPTASAPCASTTYFARHGCHRFMLATHYDPEGHRKDFAIEAAKVSHYYGTGEARKQVLYENDLLVRPGEIVIIRGSSGSGKTTLLTLMGTLRRVQEGNLNLLGVPLHSASNPELVQLRRRIGFI